MPKYDAIELGFSGVMLRGSGVPWDLRRSQPYETYSEYKFSIPIGKNGDCYDRYLLRIQEMRESVNIIKQAIKKLQNIQLVTMFWLEVNLLLPNVTI